MGNDSSWENEKYLFFTGKFLFTMYFFWGGGVFRAIIGNKKKTENKPSVRNSEKYPKILKISLNDRKSGKWRHPWLQDTLTRKRTS